MFATLAGPLPPGFPPGIEDAPRPGLGPDERLWAALEAQIEAGVGLLVDGGFDGGPFDDTGRPGRGLDRWQRASALVPGRAVKAILPGPWSLVRRAAGGERAVEAARLQDELLATADRLRDELLALAGAGCPFVQIDEPEAASAARSAATEGGDGARAGAEGSVGTVGPAIGDVELFRLAHRRLLDGVHGPHVSLSLGPGAAALGIDALVDAPYRSYGFDLIHGPDDWRVAVAVPVDRGVICGALDPASPGPGDLEVLVWAARYAAASRGRGIERVGISTVGGFERLAPEAALVKLRILGEAGRLATAPRSELGRLIDPRALDGR